MTNSQVMANFARALPAYGSNLSTDGLVLRSYNQEIARWDKGMCILANYCAGGVYISQTTSKHVGMVYRHVPKNLIKLVHPYDYDAA
jgi:hypothetical protein